MDPQKWFKTFVADYRKIVEQTYPEKKEFFPFYEPMEVHIYLVGDEKGIFPEVLAFFLLIDEDTREFLVDDVLIFEEKIVWPKNFDSLDGYDREIAILNVEYELFQEPRWPVSSISKTYRMALFESNPKDRAELMVQEHLVKGFEKELVDMHMERCRLRIATLGKNRIQQFFDRLKGLQYAHDDKERADLISKAFWILGFETLNLERMKDMDDYRELNNIAHVDVLAFLYPGKVIVSVDEGKISKERWYKLYTLSSTLKLLDLKREDWKPIHVVIGKRSKGITYLEGAVRCIGYEDFHKIISAFVNAKYRAPISPVLRALWALLGRDVKLFKLA